MRGSASILPPLRWYIIHTNLISRKHVFDDLRPYLCTVVACDQESTLFNSFRAWAQHESTHFPQHWKEETCPFCDDGVVLSSATVYTNHVAKHMREISLASLSSHCGLLDDSNSSDSDISEKDDENSQIKVLIQALKFDEMNNRERRIEMPLANTCGWLLEQPEYLDWLDTSKTEQHHGILWIKGRPGSGKSTCMKYALANSRTTMEDSVTISFFFNARGTSLERSTTGMYRSLLVQLLEKLPRLQSIFGSIAFKTWRTRVDCAWDIETFQAAFEEAVQMFGGTSVICFIDGLDECDEGQVRDMMVFFERLGRSVSSLAIRFHVLFSSRHYPRITLEKGLTLVLEDHNSHIQDISTYISRTLRIGDNKLADQIRLDLVEKSGGIFLWVVLAIRVLNDAHNNGHEISKLRQTLSDMPRSLQELFVFLLERDHNRGDSLLCIEWILFGRWPLKPEELYSALLSETQPKHITEGNPSIKDMEKFIVDCSTGLAEITSSEMPTVRFIHESTRDALLSGGLGERFGNIDKGKGHQRLAQCCIRYIISQDVTAFETILGQNKTTEATAALRREVGTTLPFLQYSVKNVLHHAEEAQACGVNQGTLLENFPLARWLKFHNLFEPDEIRRHTLGASLLCVLATHDMPALIRALPYSHCCFEAEDGRFGPPIFAALALKNVEAARALLEVHLGVTPPASTIYNLEKSCEEVSAKIGLDTNFPFSRPQAVRHCVMELCNESVWAAYLQMPDSDVNSVDTSFGWTPLCHAILGGHIDIVKLFLTRGVDMNAKDAFGRTPLSWAAVNGQEDVGKLLLEYGAEIDAKGIYGQTPLSWAAENGHQDVVKLLLDHGADINAKDTSGRTPLSWAAEEGQQDVVRLLLDHGAGINAKDTSGRTPLSWAAEEGRQDVVQLLLATTEVDIDVKDVDDRTPLAMAYENRHGGIVKLLERAGANRSI